MPSHRLRLPDLATLRPTRLATRSPAQTKTHGVAGATLDAMDNMELDDIATELETKAAELRSRIEDLTRPPEEGATIGFGKRIGDGTTQAIQQMADTSTAESLQRTLNEISDAQKRLEAGTYGRCVVCGEPIPEARLEFRPWAATCVEHAT